MEGTKMEILKNSLNVKIERMRDELKVELAKHESMKKYLMKLYRQNKNQDDLEKYFDVSDSLLKIQSTLNLLENFENSVKDLGL
jgi:hypothetical protein